MLVQREPGGRGRDGKGVARYLDGWKEKGNGRKMESHGINFWKDRKERVDGR